MTERAHNFKDVTGQTFGRLTVLSRAENDKRSRARWLCRCECGVERIVPGNSLMTGNSQSCGCQRREKFTKHGQSDSPEYASWSGARRRCTNPKDAAWKDYGGRGIIMCDRWRDSFENFLADMGRKPSPKHSLDRINNDGNYEPSNCAWRTRKEQSNNRRPFRPSPAYLRWQREQFIEALYGEKAA